MNAPKFGDFKMCREIERQTGLSYRDVNNLADSGQIRSITLTGRPRRYHLQDAMGVIEKLMQGNPEAAKQIMADAIAAAILEYEARDTSNDFYATVTDLETA